jgi:hypothetical protein
MVFFSLQYSLISTDLDDVWQLLKTRHVNHFMIWNLSERVYDYEKFDNQVSNTIFHQLNKDSRFSFS